MKARSIEAVTAPGNPHYVGDGFRVHNFIPGSSHTGMERMNPFILMDYGAKFYFPPADKPRGVGVHPHRGFETVTIAYKGRVAHTDSSGGGGVIGEGDVQWMTAASGILHKEYHEESFSKKGGDFHMVQLWVNLPAKDKMSPPKYQSITNNQIGRFELPGGGGTVEVVAGEFNGVKGTAFTFSPIHLFNLRMHAGGQAELSFPAHYNTAILVVEGSITVNGTERVASDHFVMFRNDGEDFSVAANAESIVLVLSGEPINEPIAAHGPFVMNTEDEIMQAFDDFNHGKFGYLAD